MKALLTQLLAYSSHHKKHHFLITSHGQTASMWLAAVLNRIPEVFCTHGYSYPPRGAALEEISTEELSRRDAAAQRFNTLRLQSYFSELSQATDKPIVGNVLAFYLGRLLSRMSSRQIRKRNFTLINMVRHPVTRLTSTLRTWTENDEDNVPAFAHLDFAKRCDHFIEYLRGAHKVNLAKNSSKSFLVALLAMEDIAKDVRLAKLNNIPNVRYEDVTTNKEHFEKLIQTITADRIQLSPELLQDLLISKKINAHNRKGHSQADLQFQSWEPWKQDVFKFAMKRNDVLKIYDDLDYDFSFIHSCASTSS